MESFNLTPSSPSTFTVTGIPGLEAAHVWISIPFFMLYIASLLGNFMILFVVTKEQTLHKPMYFLLCILALTDIGLSTCVVPKALCIFWFNLKLITLEGCLTQIFFQFVFVANQSTVLVTMAFDRYVAIRDPLRYTTILTNERIAVLGLLGLVRAVLWILPIPLLLWRLPFCSDHIIHDTYCEPMALMKMSCADTAVVQTYSLTVALGNIGLDLTLISFSYMLILRVVLSIPSKKAHKKALNKCTTHIGVILSSYTPTLISALSYRVIHASAAHIPVLLRIFCSLVPSMFNPVIYGVSNKEIYDKVVKYNCRM